MSTVELFRFVDYHGDIHDFRGTESEARAKWCRFEDGEMAYMLDEEGNLMADNRPY